MFIEKLGLSQEELSGKVAIVTGAGRGIGKELAKALSWLGAHVIIAEINESGKHVEKEILSEGYSAIFLQTDVSREKDVLNLEEQIIQKYGKIDILINNAIVYAAGSVSELTMQEWDKAYNVNIRGAVFLTKTFLPYMLKQNEGVINFVTSAEGTPYMAPYFASKAALTSIGQSLATELEETGVNVFVFGPGMVRTPGLEFAAKELAPRFGMSEVEFLNQGGSPGYDGPMPAEHCAAGWAYTIVNAEEYRGQIADPFGILLSKGLIGKTAKNKDLKQNPIKFTEIINRTLNSMQGVNEVLSKIGTEMEDLGYFVKKWMSRSFAKRCGIKFEKFSESISEMQESLISINELANNQKTEQISEIGKKLPWYAELGKRLANHINASKEDAKGWIKNPQELKVALDELDSREKAISAFLVEMEALLEYV